MVYSNLSSKTAEEIVNIISSPTNYQRQYVIEAYRLGREKGYIPINQKCPYPLFESDLGHKLFTYIKPKFSRSIINSMSNGLKVFLGIIFVLTVIFILGSDSEKMAVPAILFSALSTLFIIIFFFQYLFYLQHPDEVVLYQYGIKTKKKENEILLYHNEITTINVNYVRKKWGRTCSLQTQNTKTVKVWTDEMEKFLNFFERNKIKVTIYK
jgi:hypothetical protein